MTTSVTVKACCAPDVKIEVIISGGDSDTAITYLDNEEEETYYVYDDRAISVQEVEK